VTSRKTKENIFCANDLIPIVKLINPGYRYEHKSLKHDVMKQLEKNGYIKVVYEEKHPGSPKKFYELVFDRVYEFFAVSLVFHQEYIKRYKIKGTFGVIPKLKQYPKIKRDVLQHIKNLKSI
jgi:DNA-binding PadR family transcriptional regulator